MKRASGLAAIFLVMALVLLSSVGIAYWMGLYVLRTSQDISRQSAVMSSLRDTLSTTIDAETGERGYLLTSDENYLEPFHAAVDRIRTDLRTLDDEVNSGDLPGGEVVEIKRLINEEIEKLQTVIELYREKKPDQALQLIRLGQSKKTMDTLRARVAALLEREQKDLSAAQSASDHVTRIRNAIFASIAIINLGFLLWAYQRVHAEMDARETAATEVLRQKELLSVTLASIGDAVIVTDTQSNITFLNVVAEQLTGWTSKEALNQPCAKVFQIINETSRVPVASPVDKVLQHGVIVGLANHTLLIRRDGREIPIDDSGAPIREPSGEVRGVVLIFRDFSEHKANENSLRKAKEELEAASKAKDQFLAALSHELRTPLTPVLATLTTWEASDELPEAFRDDVLMVRRNIALEARLIDDLLDLTRIVRGKLLLELEVVDAHDLLRAVTGMYRSDINARKVNLKLALDAQKHHMQADPGRLQQVFWNILKNATKFTPPGGRIEIRTSNGEDGTLRIAFTDSGIGMSPEMLQRLFQPFEQGTEEAVRRSGGLGLGMAISKALVDVQGGTIAASSGGANLGSTFTLTFPSVAAPVHAAASAPSAQDNAQSRSHALRILLVEDHVDTAKVMTRLLRRLGHTVKPTESVAGATELFRNEKFDILLSDIGLPDGTGLDLIRQIRTTSDIPAIALTGFGMDDDITQCKAAGFTAHLTKPVNFQRLEMVIQQLANATPG